MNTFKWILVALVCIANQQRLEAKPSQQQFEINKSLTVCIGNHYLALEYDKKSSNKISRQLDRLEKTANRQPDWDPVLVNQYTKFYKPALEHKKMHPNQITSLADECYQMWEPQLY